MQPVGKLPVQYPDLSVLKASLTKSQKDKVNALVNEWRKVNGDPSPTELQDLRVKYSLQVINNAGSKATTAAAKALPPPPTQAPLAALAAVSNVNASNVKHTDILPRVRGLLDAIKLPPVDAENKPNEVSAVLTEAQKVLGKLLPELTATFSLRCVNLTRGGATGDSDELDILLPMKPLTKTEVLEEADSVLAKLEKILEKPPVDLSPEDKEALELAVLDKSSQPKGANQAVLTKKEIFEKNLAISKLNYYAADLFRALLVEFKAKLKHRRSEVDNIGPKNGIASNERVLGKNDQINTIRDAANLLIEVGTAKELCEDLLKALSTLRAPNQHDELFNTLLAIFDAEHSWVKKQLATLNGAVEKSLNTLRFVEAEDQPKKVGPSGKIILQEFGVLDDIDVGEAKSAKRLAVALTQRSVLESLLTQINIRLTDDSWVRCSKGLAPLIELLRAKMQVAT